MSKSVPEINDAPTEIRTVSLQMVGLDETQHKESKSNHYEMEEIIVKPCKYRNKSTFG